jgi:hypothetical protein
MTILTRLKELFSGSEKVTFSHFDINASGSRYLIEFKLDLDKDLKTGDIFKALCKNGMMASHAKRTIDNLQNNWFTDPLLTYSLILLKVNNVEELRMTLSDAGLVILEAKQLGTHSVKA